MFGVNVQVVLVDGERLGALGDAGHKLLHLQESAARPVAFEAPHRNVGGSDTICSREVGGVTRVQKLGVLRLLIDSHFVNICLSEGFLLVMSGATLSMVTSKFPKSTGSLAIFSGLMGIKNRDGRRSASGQVQVICYETVTEEEDGLSEVCQQFEHVLVRQLAAVLSVQSRETGAFVQSSRCVFEDGPAETERKVKHDVKQMRERHFKSLPTSPPKRTASCTVPVCCTLSWRSSAPFVPST